MSEILTVREVAALLKINVKTAYKLVAKGEIPGFKVGGSWRFDRGKIESWIRRKMERHEDGGSTRQSKRTRGNTDRNVG
ncbi:helix-turn-helix domain-containing protein [Mesorhizobium sophorae]|uniref:helix-turn-helix domain-containing protein n=1 Tax=Mesorhizobium sophorae TaxID=1300294 RepID=UPI000BA3AB74|nr:helix-turn-helix domain-containing protein [Mesorhizobium sophorae]